MVQIYPRYSPSGTFGLISSGRSNIAVSPCGTFLYAAGHENVLQWNIRQSSIRATFHQNASSSSGNSSSSAVNAYAQIPLVTAIAVSQDGRWLAVGYVNGSIRVFSCEDASLKVVLSGHSAAINGLVWEHQESQLTHNSGSASKRSSDHGMQESKVLMSSMRLWK